MPVFLFWNLNRKPLSKVLSQAAKIVDADIVLIAESGDNIGTLLSSLNSYDSVYRYSETPNEGRTMVFTRYHQDFVKPVYDDTYMTIRSLTLPATDELLVCAVHLPSPLHLSDDDRCAKASEVIQYVQDAESQFGHSRTVIVGDFNMDPFSKGMTYANAFHAVQTRFVAGKQKRIVSGKDYKMFFNPMWSFFSDGAASQPGTYFHSNPSYETLHFRIFDQVLLRPSIMHTLVPNSLKIMDRIGELVLVDGNHIPCVSDHLPLSFNLSL